MRLLTPYLTNRAVTSDLFEEMDRFFEDWSGVRSAAGAYDERGMAPACEISESADHYMVSMDIPGMKKEDIKVELNDHVLSVSGERKRESSASDQQKIQRYEKAYGFFKRSFTLPNSVDADKVEARYENGVLELYLPKTVSAQPKQINISSGKGSFFNKLIGRNKDDSKETSVQ